MTPTMVETTPSMEKLFPSTWGSLLSSRFRGQKHSSNNRFRAEQAEKIRSQVLRAQRSRLAEAGNAGRVVEADQRDVFKDMILLVPVDLLRDGRSIALFRVRLFCLPNHYELFRLGIRQWSVEEGVYNAEDCAVGRDSQGQRQYDDDQETGILQETANRDAHIQRDRLEQSQDSHVRIPPRSD